MKNALEISNNFVHDILSSEPILLKCELDILLIQCFFYSFYLELLNDFDIENDIIVYS